MATEYVVILITARDAEQAQSISTLLLEQRLAACVNILKDVQSMFWWQGVVAQEAESLLLVKTRADLFDRVAQTVRAGHSYEVPEIIALPVVTGQADYLAWIDESVDRQGGRSG